jgi:hypothetical protein
MPRNFLRSQLSSFLRFQIHDHQAGDSLEVQMSDDDFLPRIIETAALPGLRRQRRYRILSLFHRASAENCENLFSTSRGFGRIVTSPVVPFHQARKYRTRLVGVAADRDYAFGIRAANRAAIAGVSAKLPAAEKGL